MSDKMTRKIIAKVESFNVGPHFSNMTVQLESKTSINIKIQPGDVSVIKPGKVYEFAVKDARKDDQDILVLSGFMPIEDVVSKSNLAKIYQTFYDYAPVDAKTIKTEIEQYIAQIQNEKFSLITKTIYEKFFDGFYIHPAATKFHHAYFGGLSYHTLTMLKMIDPFVQIYPYLDKDLLIAGCILHDISKIEEISGVGGEYTKEGLLLGHIVMATIEIDRVAILHDIEDSEEVLLLKHTLLAHHGMLNFGSPKRPQIPEALLLWYLDTIDSKFSVLDKELSQTKPGHFTEQIQVLDRARFYKAKLKK